MNFTKKQIESIVNDYMQEGNMDKLIETMLDCLMKIERKSFLSETKIPKNKANGYRDVRKVYGNKQFMMQIPRDRLGYFYPLILTTIKNNEEEMHRIAFELYSKGLSQQDVGDVFKSIYGKQFSTSSISRMSQEFKKEVDDWRNRPLEEHYPVLIIDALFSNVRRGNTITNEATYTIIALRNDKTRDIIALEHFPTESANAWQEVLSMLKDRGMKSTNLVIADGLTGLENAVPKVLPSAKFQKCVVHFKRNILNKVAPKNKLEVAEDMKDIFKTNDPHYTKEEALKRLEAFINKWGKTYRRILNLKKQTNLLYYFTYLDYDYRVQSMIYTSNWVENLNKKYRKALKIRNSMPSEESVLLLLGKVAMDSNYKYLRYPVNNFKFDKTLFPE